MGKPPRHGNPPHYPSAFSGPQHAAAAHAPSLPHNMSSDRSTGSAPSSVMCVPAPLTRDLSDLSGSYMNGNTAPRSNNYRSFSYSVCSTDQEPVQGFWRQAYLLSTPCPKEPAPQTADASSTQVVVERNGVVELVKNTSDSASCSSTSADEDQRGRPLHDPLLGTRNKDAAEMSHDDLLFLSHTSASLLHLDDDALATRIPILILLLDPGRKQYELMQLWVDLQSDLVRDVLHSLQRKLSDKWRQDYDGLFQLRGDKFCQLVHILPIAKYDVRPRELWVAKPWSMAAKSAIDIARDCIQQLRAGGLLALYPHCPPGKSRGVKGFLRKGTKEGRTSPTFENADIPLTLSEEALERLYAPEGILKHYHACQFLSFRVPSIPSRVEGHLTRANNSHSRGFLGSLLGNNASFDDVSSQLSNPSDVMILPINSGKFHHSSSFSTASPSPSPSRRQGPGHGRYNPPYTRNTKLPMSAGSKWKPSGPLEVVGEVFLSSGNSYNASGAQEASKLQQDETNVSSILADLATTLQQPGLMPLDYDEALTTQDYEYDEYRETTKKRSLWKYLKALNCAKYRGEASGKLDDGHSSSRGGDASGSSGSKNNRSRGSNRSRQSIPNEANGRETPTSKGSDDMSWQNPRGWRLTTTEDGSVISDSAPLLSSSLDTSSVAGRGAKAPLPKLEEAMPLPKVQPHLMTPARFRRSMI